MAKKFPWAWGEVYSHSQKGPLAHISNTSNKLMAKKLLKLFDEYKPDFVISTHPFGSQMVSYLKRKELVSCKLATILTDFAPHEQWLVGKEQVDYLFVSHEKMRQELISEHGVDENKIFATGIPLSNRFLKHYNKSRIMENFGLDSGKKVILFFGGGEFGLGREKTLKILQSFIRNSKGYQIVAISGKNEKMKSAFEELVESENAVEKVKVLGFTNQVPELMSIADLVVTKPGGLTTTESLASGLPIVAINPIPGQEEENADFLEKAGVAIWLKKSCDYDTVISELLNNPKQLKDMKINTKLLAKKNSTMDICKIVLNNNLSTHIITENK
jgi:processive 1,2-diacylglycerol beta-glucosyltransferase